MTPKSTCFLWTFKKKAMTVPHQALWLVLQTQRYGVPPLMVKTIQSLHDGMKAEVTVDGNVNAKDLHSRMACARALQSPLSLFNFYFNLVIESWRK